MTMHEMLEQAIGLQPDGETMRRLKEGGFAMLSEDTMSQAVHDVYCGIMADHDHPSDKDRDQARALIAAIQRDPA
jgi:hypothetical protein